MDGKYTIYLHYIVTLNKHVFQKGKHVYLDLLFTRLNDILRQKQTLLTI